MDLFMVTEKNSVVKPKNGYDLVRGVMDHLLGGVEELIKIANGQETGWLEFKASTISRKQDYQPGENKNDAIWNVTKGIIALLNGWGGAVIIGITPEGIPVGWESCYEDVVMLQPDQKGDFILKNIKTPVLKPKKGSWKTGLKGILSLKRPISNEYVELRRATYKSKEVIVFMVKPLPEKEFPLWVMKSTNDGQEHIFHLYRRCFGDVGEVIPITDPDEFYKIKSIYNPDSNDIFPNLWDKFLTNIGINTNATIPSPDMAINVKLVPNSTQVNISVVDTHPKVDSVRKVLRENTDFQGEDGYWFVERDCYMDVIVPKIENLCTRGCCPII